MLKIISIAAVALTLSSCASVENFLNSSNNSAAIKDMTTSVDGKKGLVTLQSNHSVKDTADKLVSIIESKGMKVFARVDHQKNA